MKKIIYLIYAFVFLTMFFPSCKIDNFPAPNATFYGAIKDSVGSGMVETELINGSVIEAFELGFSTQVSQKWLIKNSGEFRNNLVFANKYDIYLRNGNFFPYTLPGVSIQAGDNQHDFMVVPYIRIKNCSITLDKTANKVIATFSLESGKSNVKVKSIRLYAFSDIYVGDNIKFSTAGSTFSQTYSPTKVIDASTYTLSIDLAANAAMFPAGRSFYFRVGAMADVTGVGTVRMNYVPNVKITL
jgi:hypothetical protein